MRNFNAATPDCRDVFQRFPLTTCKIIHFLYLWYTAWWHLLWSDQNMQLQSASATYKLCIDSLYYLIMCFRKATGMPHLQTQTNVLRMRDDILHLLLAAPQMPTLQPPLASHAKMQTSSQCKVMPPYQQATPRAFQEDKLRKATYTRKSFNLKRQFWYLGMRRKQSLHHSTRYRRTYRR
jgi:hypothetical protein